MQRIQVSREMHPHALCYALLADAFWSGEERALKDAIQGIREMYINWRISPIEVAYIAGVSLPSSVGTAHLHWRGIRWDVSEDYRAFLVQIAKGMCEGIKLDKERSRFFFHTGHPLHWLNDKDRHYGFSTNLMDTFLREAINETGVTLELLEEVLYRYANPKGIVDRFVASVDSAIGRYVVLTKPNNWGAEAHRAPGRYVEIVESYMEPLFSRLRQAMFERFPMQHVRNNTILAVMEDLFLKLTEIVEKESILDERTKHKIAHIATLVPYIEYWCGLYGWNDTMIVPLLEAVVDRAWITGDLLQTYLQPYMLGLERELRFYLRTNFATDTSVRWSSSNLLCAIERLTACLTLLAPAETGNVVAKVFDEIPIKGQYYGHVSAQTSRERAWYVIAGAVDRLPRILPLISANWIGLGKRLDVMINKIYTKVLKQVI